MKVGASLPQQTLACHCFINTERCKGLHPSLVTTISDNGVGKVSREFRYELAHESLLSPASRLRRCDVDACAANVRELVWYDLSGDPGGSLFLGVAEPRQLLAACPFEITPMYTAPVQSLSPQCLGEIKKTVKARVEAMFDASDLRFGRLGLSDVSRSALSFRGNRSVLASSFSMAS